MRPLCQKFVLPYHLSHHCSIERALNSRLLFSCPDLRFPYFVHITHSLSYRHIETIFLLIIPSQSFSNLVTALFLGISCHPIPSTMSRHRLQNSSSKVLDGILWRDFTISVFECYSLIDLNLPFAALLRPAIRQTPLAFPPMSQTHSSPKTLTVPHDYASHSRHILLHAISSRTICCGLSSDSFSLPPSHEIEYCLVRFGIRSEGDSFTMP